jgi:uncharacterized protein YbjT (DUF2867 family)
VVSGGHTVAWPLRRWGTVEPMSLDVVVTGASGFVGSRVAAALVDAGHTVRAVTRRPEEYDGAGRPVPGDVMDPPGMLAAIDGADVGYYLVHSLDDDDFEEADAIAAEAFGAAAGHAGLRQIVYLGGLGTGDGSPHLRSRREVEGLLGVGGVPVTTLRASIVVGHGGISWEMTRQLVAKLPVMVTPPWASTRTQPIALSDVVTYLVGVLDHPDAIGRTFEVGGAEVLTYEQMLRRTAAIAHGRDVPLVTVPLLDTPLTKRFANELSSAGMAAVTDVDAATARNLIASMGSEVVVTDEAIREVVDLEPMGFDDMVREALAERLRLGESV